MGKLTKKQKGFVEDYIKTGNGTKAALAHYNTSDYKTASVIASENLDKPSIQDALEEAGFSEIKAKSVLAGILNSPTIYEMVTPHDQIKAAQEVFKVMGTYAPEKSQSINLNIDRKLENADAEALRLEYEEKLKAKLLNEPE